MSEQPSLEIKDEKKLSTVDEYKFEPIKGYPMLRWQGKRPFASTQYYPAQLRENHGDAVNGWLNRIYWGDNLQVMSHLLKEFRGKVDLAYVDPPFDSRVVYKKNIVLRGKAAQNDLTAFEEKQYSDLWNNDEFLQFMYERLMLLRELLSENGCLYVHMDYRKVHYVKLMMDEIFGPECFLNHLIWRFNTRSSNKTTWKRSHNDLLLYKKSNDPVFNWEHPNVIEELSPATIAKYKLEDENGRYRLNGRFIKNSPIKGAKDVDKKWETTNPEWVVRDYLRDGKVPTATFFIDIENQASANRTDYPSQKPEGLLEKIICASSSPGALVMDVFMGSGTTQALAMKLGRRFIGADINLGSIQTVTDRLLKTATELTQKQSQAELATDKGAEITTYYTGFSVFNVNHYDVFRNPVQAKELLAEALEIQPLPSNALYDGEKDGRMVKIMPINRIATKADINDLLTGFDYKVFQKRRESSPSKPVESLLLVCMGHEPDLAAHLKRECQGFDLDVEVVDILRDKANLEFKRDAQAEIKVEKGVLKISAYYPMNLLQKLSLMKENVGDWRELTESVMIDWNYDGAVFEPKLVDVPEKEELVKGEYPVPDGAGTIRVKLTDLLSESLEAEVSRG